jgi:hypothetical protein
MTKITFPNGSVRGPEKLDIGQLAALLTWLPSDEMGLDSDIERYAHQRNVYRAAEAFGPSIISMLMDSGALEPEQDPLEVIRKLLKGAGF